AAEFENVPLRDSHVLEKLPDRVRRAFDLLAAQLWRKSANGSLEVNVCAFEAEQVQNVLLQRRVVHSSLLEFAVIPKPPVRGGRNPYGSSKCGLTAFGLSIALLRISHEKRSCKSIGIHHRKDGGSE